MNVLGRMVGVGLLEFLRMLLSCKICAFRNNIDPPRHGCRMHCREYRDKMPTKNNKNDVLVIPDSSIH